MKKIFRKCVSAAVAVLMAASVVPTASFYAGALENPGYAREIESSETTRITTVKVSAADIEAYGASSAIQSALYKAKDNASENNIYKVVVEKGSYVISRALRIFSNTYLSLNGVTLTRDSGSVANIIRTGEVDSADSGAAGYNAYTNITVDGGVLDGGGTKNTIIKLAHATNITIINQTLSNITNGHIMEVAGVDGLTVKNCRFSDQILTGSTEGYEAIQLDILVQQHFPTYRSEDLPMKNVFIENCSFENCPRGIGTHTAILNRPFDGVKIKNCTFDNMGSVAIQGMNWINCEITGNTVNTSPRGIAVYSVMNNGMGTYSASVLAAEGNTQAHVSDDYIESLSQNILISDNILNGCGYVQDNYAKYECGGISAIGYNLAEVYDKYSDGSGGIAKGDYYVSGVTVKNNTIDARGHGVRLVDTRSAVVGCNTISCSDNTFDTARYHGIYLYSGEADSITGNSITNACVNGIYVYNGSIAADISNNRVSNAKNYGISIDNATAGTIRSNIVVESVSNGIHITNKGSVTGDITDNAVIKTGNHGISITGASSAGSVSSNVIYGCAGKNVNVSADSKATVGKNYDSPDISVSLGKTSMTMGMGEQYTLDVNISPSYVSGDINWSSSNTSVAEVSQSGKITAKATGAATIKATVGGKSASCKITVKKAPTSITLNATELTLDIGETFDLNSSLPSGEGSYAIYYSSDTPSVASVKKSGGLVTAVAPGTATIMATTYNNKTVTCKVTVNAPEPELILGDVNSDGNVNLRDAIEIQKCVLSLISFDENQRKCGDVDKSGSLKLLDSIYVQKYCLRMDIEISGIGKTLQ